MDAIMLTDFFFLNLEVEGDSWVRTLSSTVTTN
jgi:hypothetical protein